MNRPAYTWCRDSVSPSLPLLALVDACTFLFTLSYGLAGHFHTKIEDHWFTLKLFPLSVFDPRVLLDSQHSVSCRGRN